MSVFLFYDIIIIIEVRIWIVKLIKVVKDLKE